MRTRLFIVETSRLQQDQGPSKLYGSEDLTQSLGHRYRECAQKRPLQQISRSIAVHCWRVEFDYKDEKTRTS